MTFDDALTVLSDTDQKGKLAMSQKYGDMLRATSEAMQVARECIKRCRDFDALRHKIGDSIYFAGYDSSFDEAWINEYKVEDITLAGCVQIGDSADDWVDPSNPDEQMYWTREEAEKALTEMRKKEVGK